MAELDVGLAVERSRRQDHVLVQRLRRGDEAAFLELVRAHHLSLCRIARYYVRSRSLAEDVAQETWIAVLRGIDRFEGRSALKTWIFRIAANRARSMAVQEQRALSYLDLNPEYEETSPTVDPTRFNERGEWVRPPHAWPPSTPEDAFTESELRDVIKGAIAALPAMQQAVLTLRDIEDLPASDVIELLQISDGNQRVLLHRARAKIRQAIETYMAGDVP